MFQLMEMWILAMTKLRRKGTKVSFRRHVSVVLSCLWIFIYANSLNLFEMLVRDAMDDIVDELGEDEIMEESGKLYLFIRYLDKKQ
jgi:hypothetical protein